MLCAILSPHYCDSEEDTIHLAPTVSLLYKKTLVFTIKFTLNFFLSPLSFDLPFIMLSALILKLPFKVLLVIADYLGIN